MSIHENSTNCYATGLDVYWVNQLVTVTGIANYKTKQLKLVDHVAMLRNVYHMYNDSNKIGGYYLHLGTPKGMWDKIAIYSKSIIEIHKPSKSELILYKLEYEDIIGEDKIMRERQAGW